MCEFVSWVEFEGNNYFLTCDDLDTMEGRKLLKSDVIADISGHGAIRHYYSELKNDGINKECTDFSTPDNFPADIVSAIKKGKFCGIGICPAIFNQNGIKRYNKIKDQALAEYNKIKDQAWADYNKIKDQAWADYNKIKDQALADYNKITSPALTEYKKITSQALADYNKITDQALADYNKIKDQAFWKIAKQKKYRIEKWK